MLPVNLYVVIAVLCTPAGNFFAFVLKTSFVQEYMPHHAAISFIEVLVDGAPILVCVILMRRWAKEQCCRQVCLRSFSIVDARCSVEVDRSIARAREHPRHARVPRVL